MAELDRNRLTQDPPTINEEGNDKTEINYFIKIGALTIHFLKSQKLELGYTSLPQMKIALIHFQHRLVIIITILPHLLLALI